MTSQIEPVRLGTAYHNSISRPRHDPLTSILEIIDNVLGLEVATMKQIVGIVRSTYCGTFALQYMHISDPEQAGWLKERIEGYGKEVKFTEEGGPPHVVVRPDAVERDQHCVWVRL